MYRLLIIDVPWVLLKLFAVREKKETKLSMVAFKQQFTFEVIFYYSMTMSIVSAATKTENGINQPID